MMTWKSTVLNRIASPMLTGEHDYSSDSEISGVLVHA